MLTYIAGEPELLLALLRSSGISLAALKETAAQRTTLAGVLRFLLERESVLLEFCRHYDIPPANPAEALRLLEGKGDIHIS